jgi:gamma-glutamyltranspeptidase/glutathione hydrolase
MKIRSLSALVFILFVLFSCRSNETAESEDLSTATQGMVSSAHPLASQAGVDVLKKGGNAFDAAVTVAAALNVVEPQNSGVGGYGTILVYDADKQQTHFLDSSGKIPRSVDSDVFRPPTPDYMENRKGAKAVSTPGNVNAWWAMSSQYGNLEWTGLFAEPIRLAEQGFPLSEGLADLIENVFPEMSAYSQGFYGRDGQPLSAGELLVQADLARSLRMIAEVGPGCVYGGEIGQAIDRTMHQMEGFLGLEDLKADLAEWWDPVFVEYRGFRVFTASPPSTAFPSLIRLGLMSLFDGRELGHNTAAYLHRYAEVTKHAFWCRLAYAGDPEINPPPLEKLLSGDYWEEIVDGLDLERASVFEPPEVVNQPGQNTTHFVVADKWGNIVCATQTLGNHFGSRIMAEGTGVWLNNSLAYCTFEPEGNPMDAHPGHRKLSGDCPTIIFRQGKPWAVLGTPGGHTIGQTVPQMVMNIIDFGMGIQEAIAAPKISFIEPDLIAVEQGMTEDVIKALEAMGHNLRIDRGLTNAHGLMIEYDEKGRPAKFIGGSDPRGMGRAIGY